VQLLDGVLLAARASALLDAGVCFDQRFDFHHYDLDFSRQANAAGLRVGTWPIAVTHASGGAFGSAAWNRSLALYREKWPAAARGTIAGNFGL
jgi:GT2 family glycosyltransferase